MKVAHLSVPKSGSNILRVAMGWEGKPRVTGGAAEKQMEQLRLQMENDGDVNGHLRYTEEVHELLSDYLIIFQYRDPRDTIVSWYRWHQKLGKNRTWRDQIHMASRHMDLMEPWFEHCDLAVRYEHLIEKEYPETHTFRRGIVGSYKDEFPPEHWDYYNERCAKVKYWEWNYK